MERVSLMKRMFNDGESGGNGNGANNSALHQAKSAKKDEFYTQLKEINEELRHYEKYFKGKVVYCNCDDPKISKFYEYFSEKFSELGLKKLVTTCYKNDRWNEFSKHDSEVAVSLEYKGTKNKNGIPDDSDTVVKKLEGDGDFLSDECIKILKEADVVVTNPPFSLFKKYVPQLIEHDKKFIVIGNINAATYKEIFPLIKHNKVWLGPSITSGDREFEIPESYPLKAASSRVKDGKKFIRVKGVRWYTNLDHEKRHRPLPLHARYKKNPEEYPQYDNYRAIEVSKVRDIPRDYKGAMGVPITFLDKYNPDQFEILAADFEIKQGLLPEMVNPEWKGKIDRGYINGRRMYARLLIRNKKVGS